MQCGALWYRGLDDVRVLHVEPKPGSRLWLRQWWASLSNIKVYRTLYDTVLYRV